MLAVRPSPAPLWPRELPRGRSRQISPVALARRASQERRAAKPASADTPPALDYYDSPPSPPRSLEDQVHVAYAHDDIHLAKILLLRLKGIHVTGNDDPRIAEVKDEDFDFCFVPCGRLLDDDEEKTLQERQNAELDRVKELRRTQRLKDCERIWEQGKKRLRELKTLAVRRRELEEKQRAELQDSRLKYGGELGSRVPRRASCHTARTVVSYKLLAPSSPHKQEPFVYDFMPRPATHLVSRPQTLSQPKSRSPFTRPLFDDSRAVPFSEVLTSMRGPLFPLEQRSTTPLSTKRSQDSQKRRSAELLESLLSVVQSQEEHRQNKGKAPERPVPRRKDSGGMLLPCPTCSSSSLLSSDSSSSSSSRRSWLSFSSASSSSVSTAATTPSSSPPSTLLSKPTPASPLRKTTWFLGPRPSSHTLPAPSPITLPPCKCSTSHLTPVSPADAPIPVLPDATCSTLRSNAMVTPAVCSDDTATTPATSLILRRFTQFIDLAKGFQHAYMSAAMFVVPPSSDTHAAASLRLHISRASSSSKPRRFRTLNSPGARACPVDVRVFLSTPVSSQSNNNQSTLRPIPLRPLDADEDDELELPRTVLPSPLPYELQFKPHPVPPRSPFRAVHGLAPPGNVVLRVRNVENPVYLRVRAVENETKGLPVGYGYGVGGVGASVSFGFGGRAGYAGGMYRFGVGAGVGMRRPVPMEGSLACGREKVLRVAYEGIGRSRLRYETREREGQEERGAGVSGVPVVGVEGRGRVRGRGRGRMLERDGDEEEDEEEWIRGGRRRAMRW
ncbi:hypothetical protein J132_10647 [Termitomyces sp. J132]|nr:hypothetical protein J132_10647 [Termitomyces sp. J132]